MLSAAIAAPQPVSTGVDVSAALWSGSPLPALSQAQFYFAEIPEAQRPEFVLESLARLRA